MWIIIVLAIVLLIVIISIKSSNTSSSKASNLNSEADELFGYYEMVRNKYYYGETNKIITIGTPFVEYDNLAVPSAHLAVYVSEKDTLNEQKAHSIGMDTKCVNGEYNYRFVIRKKFNKNQKNTILQMVTQRIQQAYPNDYISYEKSGPCLFVITNIKEFMETFGKSKK